MKVNIDNKGVYATNDGNANLTALVINGKQINFGSAGTIATSVQKNSSFTASYNEATSYEITATGITGTLNSTDTQDVRYEFWDKTSNSNPNFLLVSNGGKTINGQTSITINTQYFGRVLRKDSNGNWIMAL